MIDDKIAEALEAEVKESALPGDIWQGVARKIADRKSTKIRFRWPPLSIGSIDINCSLSDLC